MLDVILRQMDEEISAGANPATVMRRMHDALVEVQKQLEEGRNALALKEEERVLSQTGIGLAMQTLNAEQRVQQDRVAELERKAVRTLLAKG